MTRVSVCAGLVCGTDWWAFRVPSWQAPISGRPTQNSSSQLASSASSLDANPRLILV